MGPVSQRAAGETSGLGIWGLIWGLGWVLPPLSNSWITILIWVYIAPARTPNIDCYWRGGAVPKV